MYQFLNEFSPSKIQATYVVEDRRLFHIVNNIQIQYSILTLTTKHSIKIEIFIITGHFIGANVMLIIFTSLYDVWSGRNRQCQGQYADKGRQGHLDVDTLEQTVKMEMGYITVTTKSILI